MIASYHRIGRIATKTVTSANIYVDKKRGFCYDNKSEVMQMISVRRAVEKDIPRILELLVQVDMVHHLGRPDLFKGPATKYNSEELIAIIKDDSTPVFVCVDERDIPLGHAFCIHRRIKDNSVLTDVRTLYIDDICVDEHERGRHIGRTLYDYVVSYAKDQGFYNITLNVWTCNEAAMKFYQAMGLVPQKIGMEMILC